MLTGLCFVYNVVVCSPVTEQEPVLDKTTVQVLWVPEFQW
jgi:hypothetical protein